MASDVLCPVRLFEEPVGPERQWTFQNVVVDYLLLTDYGGRVSFEETMGLLE